MKKGKKFRRTLTIIISVCLIFVMMPTVPGGYVRGTTTGNWSEGVDTSWYTGDGPYTIDTAAELAGLASLVNSGNTFSGKTVNLGANIDLGGKNWTPIGNSSYPFKGTFDGNKHIIYNLEVNTSSRFAGVFGYIYGGTIWDLGVENVNVKSTANDVAGLSGFAGYGSTIERCYVTGAVEGYAAVSGILGSTYGSVSTVRNSYSRVQIIRTSTRGDSAGISGWNTSSSINIENCYSACIGEVRPIAGWSDGAAVPNNKISNSYFDATLSPNFSDEAGRTDLGRTSGELKMQSTFTGWDFTSIWAIDSNLNGGYPYLQGFTPGLGGAPGSITVTLKDSEGNPVTDVSVIIKDSSDSSDTGTTLSHEGNGNYSGTVTTTDKTYDVYVNGEKTSTTVSQNGNNAASVVIERVNSGGSNPQPTVVDIPTAVTGLVYNGQSQTGVNYSSTDAYTIVGQTTATDAGVYTATAKLTNTTSYKWSDGSTDDKVIQWSIARKSVDVPTISDKVYNGSNQTADVSGTSEYSVASNAGGVNAGSYDVKLTLIDKNNYQWSSEDADNDGAITLIFTISQRGNAITELSCADISYGDTPAPTSTATHGEVVYTYSQSESGDFSAWDSKNSTGTWYVKASVAGDANTASASEVNSFKVNKAELTPEVVSVDDKTYDGNTNATGTLSLSGAVNGEQPTAMGIFNWTSAEAGTNSVNVVNIQLGSEWSANYELTTKSLSGVSAPNNASIKHAELSDVSVAQTGKLYYTGNAQTAAVTKNATAVNNQTVSFEFSGSETSSYSAELPQFINAGTYKVYYKATAANHNEAYGSFTVTIDKKQSSNISAPDAPVVDSGTTATKNTITIKTVQNCEYVIVKKGENPDWSKSVKQYDSTITFSNLLPGIEYEIFARVPANNNEEASTASSVVQSTAPEKPATNNVTINYTNEIITFDDSKYEVRTGTGEDAEAVTSGAGINPGSKIYVRVKASGTAPASEWTEVQIAARPSKPSGIEVSNETIKDKSDGKISGITAEMEYSLDGGATWTSGPRTLENLAANIQITVRVKATGTAPHGEEQTFKVEPSTVTLTVSFDSNGGSSVDAATGLSYRDKLTAIPTTSRTGYTFTGWYCEGSKLTEVTEIMSDVTFTASWFLNSPTVAKSEDYTGVYDGKSHTIRVTPSSEINNAAYTYQWYKDGQKMSDKTNSSIEVKDVADSGKYWCEVTLSDGSIAALPVTSEEINVEIGKCEVSFDVADTEYTYDGTAHSATITQVFDNNISEEEKTVCGFTVSYGTENSASQINAGDYIITISLNDSQNFKFTSSQDASIVVDKILKIKQRDVTAQWNEMNCVYNGNAQVPDYNLLNVVSGENLTVGFDAEMNNAGRYSFNAALGNGENGTASNYKLTNPRGTFIIEKAPIEFEITDNTQQYDGNVKAATVTAAGKPSFNGYRITYKDSRGNLVSEPAEAGIYDIYIDISNPNYRHAAAADGGSRKVGVLNIYRNAEPVKYTVTFNGNGSDSGTVNALEGALEGTERILPECAFNRIGYVFSGWKYANKIYYAGESFPQPAKNIEFVAQWTQKIYAISGEVTQENEGETNTKIAGAMVTLMSGNRKVSSTVTDASGKYLFPYVVPGTYNLVASFNGIIQTTKVIVVDRNEEKELILPKGKTNSIVEIAAGTPEIIVGDLEKNFTEVDQATANNGGSVEIRLKAESKQEDDALQNRDELKSREPNIGIFTEITLTKTTTSSGGTATETTITETDKRIELLIPIPGEMQNKASYRVWRYHRDPATGTEQLQQLEQRTTPPNADEECFTVSDDKTYITVYAKKFSLYAVGYSEYVANYPSPPGGQEPTEEPEITTNNDDLGGAAGSAAYNKETKEVIITPAEGYEIADVLVNGESKGAVTSVKATETDKITVIFKKIEAAPDPDKNEITAEKVAANTIAINKDFKVSATGKEINVAWGKVNGADGYLIYATYCGTKFGDPVKVVSNPSKLSVSITKIKGKKLDAKKNFKVYVKAYKLVDGKKKAFGKTITAHVAGADNAKFTNVKSIKLAKTSYSLKKGASAKVKANAVLVKNSKRMLPSYHTATFRYKTTNAKVATVSKTGVIKAVGKGKCTVYVYAVNGYAKKISVTVK